MKTLIDLAQAAGKTVEKAVLSEDDDCLAVHFTDGTALLLFAGTTGGEPNMYVINDGTLNPSEGMLELDICTEEEHRQFMERTAREQRQMADELASKYPSIFRRE